MTGRKLKSKQIHGGLKISLWRITILLHFAILSHDTIRIRQRLTQSNISEMT